MISIHSLRRRMLVPLAGVFGLAVGAALIPLTSYVIQPVWSRIAGKSGPA